MTLAKLLPETTAGTLIAGVIIRTNLATSSLAVLCRRITRASMTSCSSMDLAQHTVGPGRQYILAYLDAIREASTPSQSLYSGNSLCLCWFGVQQGRPPENVPKRHNGLQQL